MPTRPSPLLLLALLLVAPACATPQPAPAQRAPAEAQAHHELHLPPVGPSVLVALDGKVADVALASVSHEGGSVSFAQLWKAAFPSEDPRPLHFDFVGSDGFRPTSRPKCPRLLTGAEMGSARLDVVTHDVSFDAGVELSGCYRVKAVVRVEASR
jgi:hypothetical protein